MSKYVALLRGIMPMNPNMRNEKICKVFGQLGFTNVQAIIASGNFIFESPSKNEKQLEAMIEKALPKYLNFKSMTIVRSHDDLLKLAKKNPFKGVDEKKFRTTITFLKNPRRAVPSVSSLTITTGPDFMTALEKQHGKEITTRTWKTVHRILVKLGA